jgi:hypothetical protein
MRRMIYRISIEKLKGNTNKLTAQNYLAIEQLLLEKTRNTMIDLPGGLTVKKDTDHLSFTHQPR